MEAPTLVFIGFMGAGKTTGARAAVLCYRDNHDPWYPPNGTLTLASYDDTHYGYLRLIVNAATLRMEFHPAEDGGTTKTPDDAFMLDLKTRAIT